MNLVFDLESLWSPTWNALQSFLMKMIPLFSLILSTLLSPLSMYLQSALPHCYQSLSSNTKLTTTNLLPTFSTTINPLSLLNPFPHLSCAFWSLTQSETLTPLQKLILLSVGILFLVVGIRFLYWFLYSTLRTLIWFLKVSLYLTMASLLVWGLFSIGWGEDEEIWSSELGALGGSLRGNLKGPFAS